MHAYYAHAAGTWRGSFHLRVTAWTGLLRATLRGHLSPAGALSAMGLAAATAAVGVAGGRLALQTEVLPGPDGVVGHQSRLTLGPLTLYEARRSFHLAADGARVTGTERAWPGGWRPLPEGRAAAVGPEAAHYELPVAGVRWTLAFHVGRHHAHARWRAPGLVAEERLRRVP